MRNSNFIFLALLLFSCRGNMYTTKGVTDFNLTYLDEIKKVKLNPEDTLFCFATYSSFDGSFFIRKSNSLNNYDTISFYNINSFFDSNSSYNKKKIYTLNKYDFKSKIFYKDLISKKNQNIYFDSLFQCYPIPNTDKYVCNERSHHIWFSVKIYINDTKYEWIYKTTSYDQVMEIIDSTFKNKINETTELLKGDIFGTPSIYSEKFKGITFRIKRK